MLDENTQLDNSDIADPQGLEYPFRFWWGFVGCLLIMFSILLFGPYSNGLVFTPDKGDMWYFWQLLEPSWQTRASAWIGYFLHQISIWWLIFYAQSLSQSGSVEYKPKLHLFNLAAIALNIAFCLLYTSPSPRD